MATSPPPPLVQWTFRRVMWATLVLVLIALSFWVLFRFNQVVFIVFIAIVLGTVIRPVVTWLNRRGLPRIVGVILVYLFMLALLISFGLLLFPLIVEQGSTIAAAVPGYYQSLREWMVHNPNILIAQLSGLMPLVLPGLMPIQQTGQQVLVFAGQAVGFFGQAARGFFILTTILLLAFYWTLDGPRTLQSLLSLLTKDHRESTNQMIFAMSTKVSFYVAGQGVLCLTIGVMAFIAYSLIGLPNALVLALIVGAFEAVPMVGLMLGSIPAGVVALSIAPEKLVWVIVATIVISQLENIVLVPRIMRKAVGVNPFVSLLAIFAFSSLFGVAGAFVAIPLAAILQLILDRFVFNPAAQESEVSNDRDYASRLRYEAQDLASDLRRQARLVKGGSDQTVKQIDQVMDEIETITTDLDALLAQSHTPGVP